MVQSLYFNDTCDPVDLTRCSPYNVDPCDCTQFYQCAQNQLRMFPQSCPNGTIYNHNNWVCDYPNDAICQTLRPWERCNVTESRMEQLRSICFKSTSNSNNTGNSDPNTNGISVALITQTVLPTVFGVLVPVIIIGLVIHRYRNRRPSCVVVNPVIPESFSDPYNSLDFVASSFPEYGPYPIQRENPLYGVQIDQSSVSHSSPIIDNSCSSVSQFDPVVNLSRMPQSCDVQSMITQEGETDSSEDGSYPTVEESDSTLSPYTISGASDDDRDCSTRRVHSENRPKGDIALNEYSFNSITGESDTTHHPLAILRPGEADRPDPEMNSLEDETASDDDSSYVYVVGCYTTAMPQPSDADREFADVTISSEDSAYVDVQQSDPLFTPYSSGNGPWPHKVIFLTKEHFLPCQAEQTECTTHATI